MRTLNSFLLFFFLFALNSYSLPKCEGDDTTKWNNCEGTNTHPNGANTFAGEWKDGLAHGKGTLTYPGGAKHVGEFKDGLANGKGTWTYPVGFKCVGEFKHGKPHGKVTYTYGDGSKYVGE